MRYLLVLMLIACGGTSSDPDPEDTGEDIGDDDDDDDDVAEDTWDNFAQDFFGTYCTACHSASPTDFSTYADVAAKSDNILCVLAADPPAGCDPWLTDSHPGVAADAATLERIEAWIEAGMPE